MKKLFNPATKTWYRGFDSIKCVPIWAASAWHAFVFADAEGDQAARQLRLLGHDVEVKHFEPQPARDFGV